MFKFHTARTLTALYLATALVLSFTHIAALFDLMGAGWEAWIAPVMIDAIAIIGKISMGQEFAANTRRRGRVAFLIAGSVSLTANITIGYVHRQYGSALLGAIVVLGALWAETHLTHLKPKATRTAPAAPKTAPQVDHAAAAVRAADEAKAAQQAKWAEAGRKAAATRKANAAKKAAGAAAPALAIPAPRTPADDAVNAAAYL